MVKVYGPMMSLDASGTLADAITFSKWKGRNYVRERVIPSNPRSGAQVGRRSMFTFLTQRWSEIGAGMQATWQTLADQLVASRFNAYLSHNMKRWHNFLAPTMSYPAAEVLNGSDDTLSNANWTQNRIRLDSEITVANGPFGTVIFADQTPGFTPSVGNVIIVAHHTLVATYTPYWTPPTVTAWSFNMRPISYDGTIEAATGEQTAAAP